MKYALHLAGGGAICDQAILRDVVQCAEEEGYDTILAGDHAILPMEINTPWPYEEYNGGKPYYGVYTDVPWADAFTVVSFAAAYEGAFERRDHDIYKQRVTMAVRYQF